MKKLLLSVAGAMMAAFIAVAPAKACTSLYVGSDLMKDGSAVFGRTEDIGNQDKIFKVIPSEEVGLFAMWEDKSGATDFKGEITVPKTFRYTVCRDSESCADGYFGEIGVNEKGVSMSATTTAGSNRVYKTADPYTGAAGVCEEIYVDYVLCQAATAKEGVQILAHAIDKYGVSYTGDGVFIADNKEVWYMEILSGHQYCAIKMPTNKAALIPNCLVIGDVDLDSPDVIASKDVIAVAQKAEMYTPALENPEVNDINLKLSYTGKGYNANNGDRIRGGQFILTGKDNKAIYTDEYQDIFVDAPAHSITLEQLYQIEGTQYQEMPEFKAGTPSGRVTREIGVSSSCECHLVQIRKDMPAPVATVEWLSLASAAYSPMVPYYAALMTDVPQEFKQESVKKTSAYTEDSTLPTSAYHEFYLLDKVARANASTIGLKVKELNRNYLSSLVKQQPATDAKILALYAKDPEAAVKAVTAMDMDLATYTLNYAMDLRKQAEAQVGKETISFDITTSPAKFDIPEKKPAPVVKTPAKSAVVTMKNVKGKKVKLAWKKSANATGYQVQVSANKKFKKPYRNYVTKKLTFTAKKFKKHKRYYARVRAYRIEGSKMIYGPWSTVKSVKIKK